MFGFGGFYICFFYLIFRIEVFLWGYRDREGFSYFCLSNILWGRGLKVVRFKV